MTKMLSHSPRLFVNDTTRARLRPLVVRSVFATVAVGALLGTTYAPASAEETEPQGVQANVQVGSVISLNDLDADFTLTGLPGETATAEVTYNVVTNNAPGYSVTIAPAAEQLIGTGSNTDTIAVSELIAGDDTANTPIYFGNQNLVHTQTARSVDGGDELTTGFSMVIPFVQADTYAVALDYVASTL